MPRQLGDVVAPCDHSGVLLLQILRMTIDALDPLLRFADVIQAEIGDAILP